MVFSSRDIALRVSMASMPGTGQSRAAAASAIRQEGAARVTFQLFLFFSPLFGFPAEVAPTRTVQANVELAEYLLLSLP
jgi:hypothetical protein